MFFGSLQSITSNSQRAKPAHAQIQPHDHHDAHHKQHMELHQQQHWGDRDQLDRCPGNGRMWLRCFKQYWFSIRRLKPIKGCDLARNWVNKTIAFCLFSFQKLGS